VVNEGEAATLGEQALSGVPHLVTTLGAAGARYRGPDRVTASAVPPRVQPVDTTGAGDTFDAGFISGMMDGLSGEECLVRAVRCGSLSTRGVGGTAAQPTLAEVRDQFRAAPAG
jgi:ribokinase